MFDKRRLFTQFDDESELTEGECCCCCRERERENKKKKGEDKVLLFDSRNADIDATADKEKNFSKRKNNLMTTQHTSRFSHLSARFPFFFFFFFFIIRSISIEENQVDLYFSYTTNLVFFSMISRRERGEKEEEKENNTSMLEEKNIFWLVSRLSQTV